MVAIVVVCVFVAPFGTDTRSLLFARLELEFLLLLAIMFSAVLSANGKFFLLRDLGQPPRSRSLRMHVDIEVDDAVAVADVAVDAAADAMMPQSAGCPKGWLGLKVALSVVLLLVLSWLSLLDLHLNNDCALQSLL